MARIIAEADDDGSAGNLPVRERRTFEFPFSENGVKLISESEARRGPALRPPVPILLTAPSAPPPPGTRRVGTSRP